MYIIWFCFKNTDAPMHIDLDNIDAARKMWDLLNEAGHYTMTSERP